MSYDYNRNGKSDLVDACIEYQLVNYHIEKSNSSPRRSGGDATGCLGSAIGIAMSIGVIWLSLKAPWLWAVAAGIIVFVLLIRHLYHRSTYKLAKRLLGEHNYSEAGELFNELGNRYDSQLYYSICRFITIYHETNKLTDYERKNFEALYNEAQRHYNKIPDLYRTDDLPELTEYSSIKKVNDKAYKKYKENRFLEKLAGEEPYIGMDVKYINDTKYGTYFNVVTISRDTNLRGFLDLQYDALKSQNIKDNDSVDEYIFYNEYGDDCHVYVYKNKVCKVFYMQLANLNSKLPYVGVDKRWIDATKLGKPDLILELTPHHNAEEYNALKKLCAHENWDNQSALLYIFANKAAKTMRKVYVHNEKVIFVTDKLPLDEQLTSKRK